MKTFFLQLFLFAAWVVPGVMLLSSPADYSWTIVACVWFVLCGVVSWFVCLYIPPLRRLMIVAVKAVIFVSITLFSAWLFGDVGAFFWMVLYTSSCWFIHYVHYLDNKFYRNYILRDSISTIR